MAKQLGLDMKEAKSGNGANLGFEEKMWKAADKLRNNMDAAGSRAPHADFEVQPSPALLLWTEHDT